MISAIDVSKYTGIVTTVGWRTAVTRTPGLRLAIAGLWHGRNPNKYAEAQLAAAREAGLKIAGYAVLNERSGVETMHLAEAAAGDLWSGLEFVALDCEVGFTKRTFTEAVDMIHAASLQAVVYTGRWFWKGHLGNPPWGSHLPLWDSLYDNIPDLADDHHKRWVPYGGWAGRMGKQYWDHTGQLPFSGDVSVFDPAILAG